MALNEKELFPDEVILLSKLANLWPIIRVRIDEKRENV